MTEEKNYDDVWDELTADMEDQVIDDSPDNNNTDSGTDADTNNETHDHDEEDNDQDHQDVNDDDDNADDSSDWKTLYEKEKHRNASWAGRIRKEREEAEKAKAELEKLRAELEALKSPSANDDHDKDVSSEGDDDDDPVRDFIEQYPEFEKPLRKLAAAEAERLVREYTKKFEPDLAAMRETLHRKSIEEHVNQIEQAHPGWKNLDTDDLNSWIEEQPSYIQATLKNIRDKGTATEVIEMLTSYKQARNITAFGDQVNPVKRESVLKKNDPHQAVKARGAGPPNRKKVNKDDFDAAWEVFAGST